MTDRKLNNFIST